jgi:hypothetical protein
VQALDTLSELQTKRILSQEPLHLEAAIERAQLLAQLTPKEKREEELVRLLKQAKREIAADDDLQSRDYHASRAKDPDKDRLYLGYMMLIDGWIAQLESQIAASEGRSMEALNKKDAAKALYRGLAEGKFAVSKYVVDHAQSHLQEMSRGS